MAHAAKMEQKTDNLNPDTADDLISLASPEIVRVTKPQPPRTTPPKLLRPTAMASRDSFSELTNIMRAKAPYMPKMPNVDLSIKGTPRLSTGVAKPLRNTAPPAQANGNTKKTSTLDVEGFSQFPKANGVQKSPSEPFIAHQRLASSHLASDNNGWVRTNSPVNVAASDYCPSEMTQLERFLTTVHAIPADGEDSGSEAPSTMQPADMPAYKNFPTAYPPPWSPPASIHMQVPLHEVEPDEDQVIVKLTQSVYDCLTRTVTDLEKDKAELVEKLAKTTRERDEAASTVTNHRPHSDEDKKAAITQSTKQNGVEWDDKEIEIDALFGKLTKEDEATTSTHKPHIFAEEADKIIAKKDQAIAGLKVAIKQLEQEVMESKAELEALHESQNTDSEHVQYAENLQEAWAKQEQDMAKSKAVIDEQKQKIVVLETECETLRTTHRNADAYKKRAKELQGILQKREDMWNKGKQELAQQKNTLTTVEAINEDLADRIRSLEKYEQEMERLRKDLGEKNAECARTRNELHEAKRRADVALQRALRADDERASLRGAAHMVQPAPNAKLPLTILPCIDCFLKNVDCDNHACCRNCTENTQRCSRWRCAQKHILGNCPDMPCQLVHDKNGWLMSIEARPKW
ncbi:hypothetical protein BDV95DRAFT_281266 [Massariosphaeria phaeospora]|uniref:Uncharacterized protein n=1 Tax=Massariosphaeria phaeospora TaxID=100035 RepID=A0A7C8MG48_9PLEO|nr:hypothetical protein BDV95DRAFT_281266 [Massariosphaeria phaeospora]